MESQRTTGQIMKFEANEQGMGRGKLRYRVLLPSGSARFATIDFLHDQCEGAHGLPIAPGLRPELYQYVAFELYKDRDGRRRAGMITAMQGGGQSAPGVCRCSMTALMAHRL